MSYFLMDLMMQYACGVLAGTLAAGIICNAYFSNKFRNEMRGYENEILEKQARIFELEDKVDKLEKLIVKFEKSFAIDQLFMN